MRNVIVEGTRQFQSHERIQAYQQMSFSCDVSLAEISGMEPTGCLSCAG